VTEDEEMAFFENLPRERALALGQHVFDTGYSFAQWLEREPGAQDYLYDNGYMPRPKVAKRRVRHPDLDRGRYIVPKELLALLERIAAHQQLTVKQLITNHLYSMTTKYKNLPKPPPLPAPAPVEVVDDNPLFTDYQREWMKGHAYCGHRGTDHHGEKYTDKMWYDSVVRNMERERLTGERPRQTPNGIVIEKIHAGVTQSTDPIKTPEEREASRAYEEWFAGGCRGPIPPRPNQNMEYYGFKKT